MTVSRFKNAGLILGMILICLLPLPFARANEDLRFIAGSIAIVVIFLFSGIWYLRKAALLMEYVECNHEALWSQLNTLPILGPGYRNNIKIVGFIFGGGSRRDPLLEKLRHDAKDAAIRLFFLFISTPLLFVIYMTV